MKIGVLALQGDFALHRKALDRVGVASVEVRMPRQLDEVAGLIMPGGESTTLLKLMEAWDFVPALEKFHAAGKPIFGTCAGMILLAREVQNPPSSRSASSTSRWSATPTAARRSPSRRWARAIWGRGRVRSRWFSSGPRASGASARR